MHPIRKIVICVVVIACILLVCWQCVGKKKADAQSTFEFSLETPSITCSGIAEVFENKTVVSFSSPVWMSYLSLVWIDGTYEVKAGGITVESDKMPIDQSIVSHLCKLLQSAGGSAFSLKQTITIQKTPVTISIEQVNKKTNS